MGENEWKNTSEPRKPVSVRSNKNKGMKKIESLEAIQLDESRSRQIAEIEVLRIEWPVVNISERINCSTTLSVAQWIRIQSQQWQSTLDNTN